MRYLTLMLAVTLVGCAGHRGQVGYCSVLTYAGQKGEPYGLVDLDPELEKALRAQLPAAKARSYICWYATGSEIIAASRGSSYGVAGIAFEHTKTGWRISDTPDRILELIRAIE